MDDRNPYAPPASQVADLATISPKPPKVVSGAISMMWAWLTVSLGTVALPTAVALINRPYGVIAILILVAIPVGIPILIGAWLTSRIGAGRSWARILVCVALAVSSGYPSDERSVLFLLLQGKMSTTLIWSSQFMKLLLSTITIVLLFTPPANRWFAGRT
jgi:hypothetical protein